MKHPNRYNNTAWTKCSKCGDEFGCFYISFNKFRLGKRLNDMHKFEPYSAVARKPSRAKELGISHCDNNNFLIRFSHDPENLFDYHGQNEPLIEWLIN